MTYKEALVYLEGLGKFGSRLGLERIQRLLELMHYPERRFKTIHITGTNGKGSTTATLSSILVNSGIKTGMYTSPHLSSYTERMIVNGEEISEEQFANAIYYTSHFVNKMAEEGFEHPTEFEVLTAAAFYYFAAVGVEYAVIEVGLGGLLDSTNVIMPEAAIITNVALEHADRCGGTLEGVARHKAGIIKEGIKVITAAKGDGLEIIRETCGKKGAKLYALDEDFAVKLNAISQDGQSITLYSKEGIAENYEAKLLGRHQAENSALAIIAAKLLGERQPRITAASIQQGLSQVYWPGRFEILKTTPVIVIDGAHNPAGAKVLRENLDILYPDKPRCFLLGILADKDIEGITGVLIRAQDKVITAAPISDRAGDPKLVAEKISASHVETAASIEEGLSMAKKLAACDEIIVAAGSLYLIGTVRELLKL